MIAAALLLFCAFLPIVFIGTALAWVYDRAGGK